MAEYDDEPIDLAQYDIEGFPLKAKRLNAMMEWLYGLICDNVANYRRNSETLTAIKAAMLTGLNQQLMIIERDRINGINSAGFFPDEILLPFSPYDDRAVGLVLGRYVPENGMSMFMRDWLLNGELD